MARPSRRQILRLGSGVGVCLLAGCTSTLDGAPAESTGSPSPGDGGASHCDEHAYERDEGADGELPWDLQIRNVDLSTHPVSLVVTAVSGETPTEVVSCTATEGTHAELVFDLSRETTYRVRASMDGRDAEVETRGGFEANEALEVTVEDAEFVIRRIHYDPGMPTGG